MPNPLLLSALPSIIDAGKGIINNLFPDPQQKVQAELELLKLANSANQGQLEINKVEASHRSIWVAGWRPFIGWTCGSAIAYCYVLRDFIHFTLAAIASWPEIPELPVIDLTDLWPVLLGLLGLGTLRTHEKIKGAAR